MIGLLFLFWRTTPIFGHNDSSFPYLCKGHLYATAPSWQSLRFQFIPLREGRLYSIHLQQTHKQFQFTPLREGRRQNMLKTRLSIGHYPQHFLLLLVSDRGNLQKYKCNSEIQRKYRRFFAPTSHVLMYEIGWRSQKNRAPPACTIGVFPRVSILRS